MKPSAGKDTPRKTAARILDRLDTGDLVLDVLMDRALEEDLGLTRKDRALVMALVFGVTRNRGRIDWIIGNFSKTKLNKIQPGVLNILRMGVFQLLFLDRVPPALAVDSSVEMAKKTAPAYVVKFVNGLLRNVERNGRELVLPDFAKDPVKAICVGESYPEWLVRRWVKRFGPEQALELCRAGNRIAPITIRVNPLAATRDQVLEEILDLVQEPENHPWLPDAVSFSAPNVPVFELPGFREGRFSVQDAASQLVALCLSPQPGDKVLDACAGLGSKTAHLAQLMGNQGEILATDVEPSKIRHLSDEMKRLGIAIVRTEKQDFSRAVSLPGTLFDNVLVDAPCTGLGVIRRNPDSKWSKNMDSVRRHAGLQAGILANASALVKPGGLIVYSVCSMEPEETENIVREFLKDHPDFAVEECPLPQSADKTMLDGLGCLRTFPHKHDMDGFFAARMRRQS
ncbi:MAG: 16S rRNA (cytosine(967)-C(5))-methyltransferase RsmB [Desulfatibacillum sp.]|nr:16S rRNA (cytosine(967)-C(5))-methyltransferase RsmB [Desulfatibacillum sp.]